MSESPTKHGEQEQKAPVSHDVQSHDVNAIGREAPAAVLEEGTLDPVYAAKARVLNKAIQDIGMGRYQWQVGGFGGV